jgi:hypothetical protein
VTRERTPEAIMSPLAVVVLIFVSFLLTWLLDAPQVRLAVDLFGAHPQVQAVVGWAPLGLLLRFLAIGGTPASPPSARRPWRQLATVCGVLMVVMLPPVVGTGTGELTGEDAAALIAQAYAVYASFIALLLLLVGYRWFASIRAKVRGAPPARWPPPGPAFRWTVAVVDLVALVALLPWAGHAVQTMT